MDGASARRGSFVAAIVAATLGAGAAPMASPGLDVLNLPLEELGNIEVTSAGRRAEPLRDAATAIFVLTRDDIRRSGARSIPDALRLVPGVEVARYDGSKWGVSIRGFNSRSANKLLVLIDGRSVYDPLFSGVFWEVQDVPLELIDRIEVIRGPGGTQWGANAVNGVINVITRRADETSAYGVTLGGGDYETEFVTVHATARFDGGAVTGFVKHFARGPGAAPGDTHDDIDQDRAGLRADLGFGGGHMMVKAEAYQAAVGYITSPSGEDRTPYYGANMTVRWDAAPADGVERWVQGYLDRTVIDDLSIIEERVTGDLEYRQVHGAGSARQHAWGIGYRNVADEIGSHVFPTVVAPDSRTDETWSAFLEGQYAMFESGRATLGTKVEHNGYTGYEWQPSLRYAHRHESEATTWGAIARAVRIPSRLESDLAIGVATGNPDLEPEALTSYELGHRRPFGASWWVSSTVFVHRYDDLVSSDVTTFANDLNARSRGLELSARWLPRDELRGDISYTYLDLDADADPGSTAGPQAVALEGRSARHRASVRVAWDPRPRWSFDAVVRHVGALPTPGVDDYTVLDLRCAWQPREGFELALVARDLGAGTHQELGVSTAVGASAYLLLRWTR